MKSQPDGQAIRWPARESRSIGSGSRTRERADGPTARRAVQQSSLFPDIPQRHRRLPVLNELRRGSRGTRFYEQPVRSLLNAPESTGMGFWSLNPYLGCEFGCTYCYARYSHQYAVDRAIRQGTLSPAELAEFEKEEWKAFEHRILVKRRDAALRALERDLVRVLARYRAGERNPIAIGTSTDPYQPAERKFEITRSLLERLVRERGLEIGIVTKSPLVCRDIDLLRKLQRRGSLAVRISLITANQSLIRKLEARSPTPRVRLNALRRLRDAGIHAGLIVAPILPGITDSRRLIDDLLRHAADAGARFINPVPLRLYGGIRDHFLPVIDRHFPHLSVRYRRAYNNTRMAPRDYTHAVRDRFRELAEKHGLEIESDVPGHTEQTDQEQLGLWK